LVICITSLLGERGAYHIAATILNKYALRTAIYLFDRCLLFAYRGAPLFARPSRPTSPLPQCDRTLAPTPKMPSRVAALPLRIFVEV
jgi:hypothetical protein